MYQLTYEGCKVFLFFLLAFLLLVLYILFFINKEVSKSLELLILNHKSGLIKTDNGVITLATPEDITSQTLLGFNAANGDGSITEADSILTAIKKLAFPINASFAQIQNQYSFVDYNAQESRAIPILNLVGQTTLIDVNETNGFCTYKGSVDAHVMIYVTLTLNLTSQNATVVNHFIGVDANETWVTPNPYPQITTRVMFQTLLSENQDQADVSISFFQDVYLAQNQSFALCGKLSVTLANAIYKFVHITIKQI